MTTHFKLSNRKIEVMRYAAQGLAQKEIADKMSVTYDTIQSHVYQALKISGCKNCVELVYVLTKNGIL